MFALPVPEYCHKKRSALQNTRSSMKAEEVQVDQRSDGATQLLPIEALWKLPAVRH